MNKNRKQNIYQGNGSIVINNHCMEWQLEIYMQKRLLGLKKNKIANVKIFKDGLMTTEIVDGEKKKTPDKEDDESYICYNYAIKKSGIKLN